jgi:anti-sigma factor RsiW
VTGDTVCAPIRLELGVYLLGAIEPAQRARVDQHLATCPSCRAELAGLAGLPALLRRVPADVATQLPPDEAMPAAPGRPLSALLGQMARARRRKAILTVAAALAAGFAAGLGLPVLQAAVRPPAITTTAVAAEAANPATGAWAAVRYTTQPWGTELRVRVTGIPDGTRCQLVITSKQGPDITAGGWIITAGHHPTWYPASAPVQATSLRGFEITARGKILVTITAR